MFICICNAIRECDVRRAALAANGDAEAVYAMLGKRPQCRQCLDDADAFIMDERRRARVPVAA
ncbi:ferredoxin [Erythrobacter arachoides]|uniref:Ferredoxin n=1 Tax=Aurantiacibacter arachoides TaxID=1850444 RepID=A0A845A432_9SPHN|nr:ferredoxin [Aurantiacibacter arachoides]MXO92359.1 ferredoxin [Aurantiacibacter arachoides]GGD57789.1 hypothetical protein GCM10011411_17300 [Aurantiacibacter arachoides]